MHQGGERRRRRHLAGLVKRRTWPNRLQQQGPVLGVMRDDGRHVGGTPPDQGLSFDRDAA